MGNFFHNLQFIYFASKNEKKCLSYCMRPTKDGQFIIKERISFELPQEV